MSRIGKQPVLIPDKVKVEVKGHTVKVEGPKGKVSKSFAPVVNIAIVSTSKGLMKDADCRRNKAGGELVCNVW